MAYSVASSSAPYLHKSRGGGAPSWTEHVPHLWDPHVASLPLTPKLFQPPRSVRSLTRVRWKEEHWDALSRAFDPLSFLPAFI